MKSIDISIMNTIKNGEFNMSNTIANLHAIYGQNRVNQLMSEGYIKITKGLVLWTLKGHQHMTPLDLSENSSLNSDSSSSLLYS